MSRSYRKTPVFSFCGSGKSEKEDKKIWHGAMRASERDKLHKIPLYDDISYYDVVIIYVDDTIEEVSVIDYPSYGGQDHITTHTLDVSDVWSMSKDGKYYWSWKTIMGWCKDRADNPFPRRKGIVSKERYFYKDFKAK